MALKGVLVPAYIHSLICNYSPPCTLLPAILASVLLLEFISLRPPDNSVFGFLAAWNRLPEISAWPASSQT